MMAARSKRGGALAVLLVIALLSIGSGEGSATVEPDPDPQPAPKPRPRPLAKAVDKSKIDIDRARIEAQTVANDLKKGKTKYSKQRLSDWQGWAGLVSDGLYGGRTHGALVHYGATGMPKPWSEPRASQPYTEPGSDDLRNDIARQREAIDAVKQAQAAAAAELAARVAQQQKVPSQKEQTSPAGTVTRPPPPLPQLPQKADDADDRQEEMFPARGDDEARRTDEFNTRVANSTTEVSPTLQPSPTGPRIPAGYSPAKAKAGASALSAHLTKKGPASYSRDQLKVWQGHAGLAKDGLYGGSSRGALIYYGVRNPPRPFAAPVATIPYVPPERRA